MGSSNRALGHPVIRQLIWVKCLLFYLQVSPLQCVLNMVSVLGFVRTEWAPWRGGGSYRKGPEGQQVWRGRGLWVVTGTLS